MGEMLPAEDAGSVKGDSGRTSGHLLPGQIAIRDPLCIRTVVSAVSLARNGIPRSGTRLLPKSVSVLGVFWSDWLLGSCSLLGKQDSLHKPWSSA